MSFSVSPEIISPATSTPQPQSSPPAPQEQIVTPFPSPLPPETTADSSPPAVPPATDSSSPPVNSVSTTPPPSPAPEIPPPPAYSPPPAAPLPIPPPPSPILASPPPPETATPSSTPPAPESPPPPETARPSSTPAPESPPPPETARPSSTPAPEAPPPPPEPSPVSKATPPAPQAPENTNLPPPEQPSVTSPPAPRGSPPPLPPQSPLPAEPIPSPSLPDTETTTAPPALASPPPPPQSAEADGSLPAAVQIQKPQPELNVSPGFIAGCVVVSLVVVALFVGVVACVVCYKRRRRRTKGIGLPQHYHPKAPSLGLKENSSIRTLATLQPPPIKTSAATTASVSSDSGPSPAGHGGFSYGQLAAATGGFSEANLLGEGGFGCVYKGVLGSGKEVAVKQLRTGSRQGEREFRAEVDIISRIHHKHLVSLVGYCINGAERLLVYEFVPNNTLEFHLYGKQEHVMEWETRLKIAIGSARGLAYLHEDCNPKVIHRDIKASNILLDFRFEAKVSDFGLAKSFSDTNTHISHISTRVVGTFGYLAPEYASSGKVTEKSDVYSYGVMLLELITGRPPISSMNQGLVEWARPLLAQAMEDGNFDTLVDPRLQRNYDAVEMSRMVTCAAACVRHSAWLRPRMSQIVHALEGHASLMDLHEGVTPGSSTLYSSPSSSYNAHQYRNDLNKFHIAVADQEYGNDSMRSGSTSEYGLNPSVSSGELPPQTFRS